MLTARENKAAVFLGTYVPPPPPVPPGFNAPASWVGWVITFKVFDEATRNVIITKVSTNAAQILIQGNRFWVYLLPADTLGQAGTWGYQVEGVDPNGNSIWLDSSLFEIVQDAAQTS